LRASLATAVSRALTAQGVSSVDALTYDKTKDDIVSATGGVVGVTPIDWQNRPTFQQVVHFTSRRASTAAAPAGAFVSGAAVEDSVALLALLVLLACAASSAVRRGVVLART
jgi:hypothetical protein